MVTLFKNLCTAVVRKCLGNENIFCEGVERYDVLKHGLEARITAVRKTYAAILHKASVVDEEGTCKTLEAGSILGVYFSTSQKECVQEISPRVCPALASVFLIQEKHLTVLQWINPLFACFYIQNQKPHQTK